MDATARLLAAKPVYRYYKPPTPRQEERRKEKQKEERKGRTKARETTRRAKEKKAPTRERNAPAAEKSPEAAQTARPRQAPSKGIPAPLTKGGRKRDRGRGRIPPRVEGPQSRQKDSTEQKSLMKPFYISHD